MVSLWDGVLGAAGADSTAIQCWTWVVGVALTLGVAELLRAMGHFFSSSQRVTGAALEGGALAWGQGTLTLRAAAEALVFTRLLPVTVLIVTCSSEVAEGCSKAASRGVIGLFFPTDV